MENVLRCTFSLSEKFYTLKKSRNQRIIFIFSFLVNPAIISCIYIFTLSSTTISQKKKKKKKERKKKDCCSVYFVLTLSLIDGADIFYLLF